MRPSKTRAWRVPKRACPPGLGDALRPGAVRTGPRTPWALLGESTHLLQTQEQGQRVAKSVVLPRPGHGLLDDVPEVMVVL